MTQNDGTSSPNDVAIVKEIGNGFQVDSSKVLSTYNGNGTGIEASSSSEDRRSVFQDRLTTAFIGRLYRGFASGPRVCLVQ